MSLIARRGLSTLVPPKVRLFVYQVGTHLANHNSGCVAICEFLYLTALTFFAAGRPAWPPNKRSATLTNPPSCWKCWKCCIADSVLSGYRWCSRCRPHAASRELLREATPRPSTRPRGQGAVGEVSSSLFRKEPFCCSSVSHSWSLNSASNMSSS